MKERIYIVVLGVIASLNISLGQVSSPKAADKTVVGGDTIYWYKSWEDATVEVKVSGTTKITWYEFDEESMSFSKLLKTSDGTNDSYTASGPIGIKCEIVEGEKKKEQRFWMEVPEITGVSFSIDSVYCDGMDVTVNADGNKAKVFDASVGKMKDIAQKVVYEWYVADTLQMVSGQNEVTLESPMEDSSIKVIARNQVDKTVEAVDSIMSYGVKAKFSHKQREREVKNEMTSGNSYSSPAEIEFTNESKGNVTVYEWVMGTMSRVYDKNPVYSFQPTGTHRVSLIVTDETTGCSSIDSTLQVTITDAFLGFPNVFTPNGDDVNDEFRCAYKSLKTYEITIYNRWGREVYHSTDPSKGWDGKEGNAKAAEGLYMYVAEATGYDKGVRIRKHGSVTLVR
ncbi:MAG: gliding motility-associated C-terminal domain-containing protein [Bacteroidales bacterium]|nr:gliding motility-associated C-terminal domain-containing protein [Bacteroidales bacterium]